MLVSPDRRGPHRSSGRTAVAPAVLIALLAGLGGARGAVSGEPAAEPAPRLGTTFPTSDFSVPGDDVLLEQLADAVFLRRREDFDRMLDARDPGELVEHATLSEAALDRGVIGLDALFIVGDELFGYAFRPENGWGAGGRRASVGGPTPAPHRVHAGDAGGPDAFGCFACHSKGGPDGAGAQTQNAFMRGDGDRTEGADERNPPHVLGLGPIACLAREMSAELAAIESTTRQRARDEARRIEAPLVAKGIPFGRIAAMPDGTVDRAGVDGVDADLIVRPFGWKGHQATLRGMSEESLHIHQGLLTNRIQLAVGNGSLAAEPYGAGPWYDVDEDGVSLEIHAGMVTTLVGYLAQLEVPVMRAPREPDLVDRWAAGRTTFDEVGCAACHVPTLELTDPKLDAREDPDPTRQRFVIDVAEDGDGPKIEPKFGGTTTPYLVHLFSDLKRHDMGATLAAPAAQGRIPAEVWLTRPLWGLADTAPYLHDGRAPTVHDAIVLHDGEGAAARDAYLALPASDRASLRVFLASLGREAKLFVP